MKELEDGMETLQEAGEGSSTDDVIKVLEKELSVEAEIGLEQGIFQVPYKETDTMQSLFSTITGIVPQLFYCYIDDCIGAASCAQAKLEQFFANNFHPVLKFTWSISDTSLLFLDLSVSIS
eukprot:g47375.t1